MEILTFLFLCALLPGENPEKSDVDNASKELEDTIPLVYLLLQYLVKALTGSNKPQMEHFFLLNVNVFKDLSPDFAKKVSFFFYFQNKTGI